MDKLDDIFRYIYSSDLEHRIQIKIGTFEGKKEQPSYEKLLEDPILRFSGLYWEECPPLVVRLQVFDKGQPLGLPVCTSYKPFSKRYSWNEWVTLPLQFCDLPQTAMLALTILDCAGAGKSIVVGGSTISLFGKNGMFRQGMFDLRVWVDVEGDGNTPSTTPGKGKNSSKYQMQRLGKLAKKHCNGQIQKVDWLDRLTFREIEMINEKEKRESEYLYLMIEFPSVTVEDKAYTIMYYEPDGDKKYTFASKQKLVTIPDSEISQENLVERKHHTLARSARSGITDADAKPNSATRAILSKIIDYTPFTQPLTSEHQDLIWKYRFFLASNKKALPKFLSCVNWESGSGAEVQQALMLLEKWQPMDVEDALEILSPAYTHPLVRSYAITRLDQAPDDDLLLYLLQLVQALKYENIDYIMEAYKAIMPDKEILKSFDDNGLDQSSTSESNGPGSNSGSTMQKSSDFSTKSTPIQVPGTTATSATSEDSENTSSTLMSENIEVWNLSKFLIYRACRNSTLANYLYWYLSIEVEDQESVRKQDERVKNMYLIVLKTFLRTLEKGNTELRSTRQSLDKQQKLMDELVKLVKIVAKETGNRNKKTEKFQQLLADDDYFKINFSNFEPRPLPLDPDINVRGIVASKTSLFKSALMPAKLTFLTTDIKQEYVAIFKHGDDLRQDQLIVQMITLMDKLLRRENLDLKLTPYRVLATSSKHGFLQYIDSVTVAEVLAKEGSIHNFFRKYNPCETGPYGIIPEVMETYIKSCAGYCVITYVLGIGDRHLDNLLLTTSGNLFHIDFGYILGRDPKPMPPPMKLSKEMVDGMGGITSEHHTEFRKECYTAFLHLRRHASLILNLFSLMVDASVPDIALEPDKAVKKVEENLRLKLNDEEAVLHLQNLLDVSITAVMPALVEQIHKIAQYWRK